MAAAEVGDDVLGDDPSVVALQEYTADLLGKEAAVFVPSGSMANQIAVRLHCQPGDEFLCEAGCHIYNYEQGGYAQLSGVAAKTIEGTHGRISIEQLAHKVNPDNEHLLRTAMITLENTHNRGGGTVQPLECVKAICTWAKENGLARHLDGARLFNAVAASGIEASEWSSAFDTVCICYSKGLGAPVGSAIAGTREMMKRARRIRKLLGGGMRQVGIIAAGALYAIKENRLRLTEDHANASLLASAIDRCSQLSLVVAPESNIVIFEINAEFSPAAFCEQLAEFGVYGLPFGPKCVRLVTHRDVDRSQTEAACEAIERVAEKL